MAINWGAALGKAVETGISTYERLGEEELRQLQRDELKRKIAEEQALNEKFAGTYGRVGQENDYTTAIQTNSGNTVGGDLSQAKMLSDQAAGFGPEGEKASAAAAAGAMRENAVRQGVVKPEAAALPDIKGEAYTLDRAQADYKKAAAGVSRRGYIEALGIKKESRASEIDDKFDESVKWRDKTMFDVTNSLQKTGLSKLPEVINPHLKDQGMKAVYNEKTGAVNILDKSGKVIKAYTDIESAEAAAKNAIGQEWQSRVVGLLGDAKSVVSYMNQREEIDMKKPYYEAEAYKARRMGDYYAAGGAAMNRTPKKEVSNSDIKSFVTEFGDKPSNEKDPKTGKAIAIRDLPLNKQAAYAHEFYLGKDVTPGGYDDKNAKGWDPSNKKPDAEKRVEDKKDTKPNVKAIDTESLFDKETRLLESGKIKQYSPEAIAEQKLLQERNKNKQSDYLKRQQAIELERSKLAR